MNPMSNLMNQMFSFVHTEKTKIWKFPKDRFVIWGSEDESFCRMASFGEEVEAETTFTLENCFIEKMDENGQVSIRVLPNATYPIFE